MTAGVKHLTQCGVDRGAILGATRGGIEPLQHGPGVIETIQPPQHACRGDHRPRRRGIGQQRLELVQLQLDYTRLTAPVAGAIATVEVEVNENVQAGQPIVKLSSSTMTEVGVDLPGSVITAIREGAGAVVECDALPDETFDAFVTEVGVAASGATTFPVTVQLAAQSDRVRPGMAAEVTFRLASSDTDADRIFVPAVAVGEDRGGRFVFLAEPEGAGIAVVRRHPVTVGDLTTDGENDLIEVLDGLSEGDVIITAGVRRLTDGRQVRLVEAAESQP